LVVVKEIENGVKPKRDTIFHTILNASGVDAPPVDHIVDEAYGLTVAAAETTGNAMAMCAFHVLYNPNIYAKLRKELLEAFPNPTAPLDFLSLEKLPYLTGVVKEGLRLSYGVIYPLPRVVSQGGASYNGVYIPEGVSGSDKVQSP
jgi:cytochrome P450